MKRFTKRDKYDDVNIIGINSARLYEELDYDEDLTLTFALNKFAYLEDIEEEIGISLIKLFLALKDGIYAKAKNTQKICQISEIISIGEKSLILPSDFRRVGIEVDLDYKNYGKTWALSKEELEVE